MHATRPRAIYNYSSVTIHAISETLHRIFLQKKTSIEKIKQIAYLRCCFSWKPLQRISVKWLLRRIARTAGLH